MGFYEFVAAIITAGLSSSALTVVVQQYFKNGERVLDSYFKNALNTMHAIFDCLSDGIYRSKASRALLLFSCNGGGVPHAGSDLYITISHEFNSNVGSIKHEVQNLPVDKDYVHMLSALVNNPQGNLLIKTDNLRKGSLLREIHVKSGIKQTLMFSVINTNKKFYYCSFNFIFDEPLTSQQFSNCQLQAFKMKSIIEQDIKQNNRWWKIFKD